MQLRFAASRRAFEAEATRLLAQARPSGLLQSNRFVGLYYVYYVQVEQSLPRVRFIAREGILEGWGFLYRPGQAQRTNAWLPDGWSYCED
jgi:hypothetical protein